MAWDCTGNVMFSNANIKMKPLTITQGLEELKFRNIFQSLKYKVHFSFDMNVNMIISIDPN